MGFQLSQKDFEKIEKWDTTHDCCIQSEGACGGRLTYSFTPTSLGTVIKVQCACGKEIDLTDYDGW